MLYFHWEMVKKGHVEQFNLLVLNVTSIHSTQEG
jgi:hypothetical protein